MKKMTKVLALVLALAMCLALCACGKGESKDTAGDKKTFIMGVDPEYPPFSYLGDDGKFTGFDVEICQAVCDLLGWDLQVFGVNWDQKLVQLDSKECDCVWSGMTILDSMKDAGYVLSTPYYDNTQVIMVKEGSDIKSSADLAGQECGRAARHLRRVPADRGRRSGEPGQDLRQAHHLRQLPQVLHRAGRAAPLTP